METIITFIVLGLIFVGLTIATPTDESSEPLSRLDPRLGLTHHH